MRKGPWLPTANEGVYQRFVEGEGDQFHVEYTQDVEPILDQNARERNSGINDTGFARKIASIPIAVFKQWVQEGFDARDPNNRKELMRRLSSSDYSKLRTSNKSFRIDDDWRPM